MIFRLRLCLRLRRDFGWSLPRAWRAAGEHGRLR